MQTCSSSRVAVGACACSGGIFNGCYCVTGGVDTVLPVDAYVPGCAVRPEALISAVTQLLEKLEQTEKTPAPKAADGGENDGK